MARLDTERRLERLVGSRVGPWVAAVARRPLPVLLAVAIVTAVLAFAVAGRLGVDADQNAMLSNELPHRLLELEYRELFPTVDESLVVVVDAPTPEEAARAAQRLASRMEGAPDLFHSVFLPRGPFFEQHGLLYLERAELEDFADRLARIQPYLSGLARDGTLRGLAELVTRGVRGAREGDVGGEVLGPVLERMREPLRAAARGSAAPFSWAEVVAGRDLDLDARRRFVLAQPVLDFSDLAAARRPIRGVRRMAVEEGLVPERGFRVRMTGDVALAYEEMRLVEGQARWAGVASFAAVSLLLLVGLGSPRLAVATLLTLAAGLVWTAAFAAFAIGHLNLISVAFAVLFIGLGVDFGVHFCLRYRELREAGEEHVGALRRGASDVGSSLVLCAVTTAIGFYAFAPTDFKGVAELGVIAGTGMFISLLLTFTLLPAVASLGWRAPRPGRWRRPRLPSFPVRHPRVVSAAALGLGAGAVLLLPRVSFDHNPLRVRDPAAESVQILEELLERGNPLPWELNAVAPDLERAEALADELAALPTVDRAITVRDFIPGDQAEKLEIIEDVALFLPPLSDGEPAAAPSADEEIAALRALEAELGRWLGEQAPAPGTASAGRFRADLEHFLARVAASAAPGALLDRLEESLLGSLPEQLRLLEAALSAGPVTLETLPQGLVERMVSSDGAVRVRIFPSEDIGDNRALARFVESVRRVAPEVTGGAVNILEASRAVVRALREAFAAAAVVIAVLLLLLWRTLSDALLVLAPLGLAAVLTGAAAVLLGIPFNYADVIMLPLLLGIGVDSGIHLVHRSHMGGGEAAHLLDTSTARGVVLSSVTTIASFGSLAFASHRGMASLGQLLTVGVALTVLCNLFVLPALLEWRARRRAAREAPV